MFNYYNTGVTVELREIVESGVNVWGFEYSTPRATLTHRGKTVNVPFNKEDLEKKILDHYWLRQIGQETVGRWLHYFRSRMKEIMPYYVQLYEFEAKWFAEEDPLESYNLTEEYDREHSDTGTATGSTASERSATSEKTGTTDSTRRLSDTPQNLVENLNSYLTEATVENGSVSEGSEDTENASGTSEQSTQGSGTEKYTLTRRGNIGVQPLGSEVRDIRAAFINIDQMVINEFKDLFLQVY